MAHVRPRSEALCLIENTTLRRAQRPRRLHLPIAAALFGLGLTGMGPAAAQSSDAAVLPSVDFFETFVGAAPPSPSPMPRLEGGAMVQSFDSAAGRLIVGVGVGAAAADAPADLSALRVHVPEASAGDRLCVAISTTDGRYTAESVHLVDGAYDSPPALGLDSRHASALSDYRLGELLVTARRAATCDMDAAGVAAPVAFGPERALIAAINLGRGRPKAWIEKDGAPVTDPARCRRDEQAAKTHDCVVDLGRAPPGRYILVVDAGARDDPDFVERTPVVLP